MIYKYRQGASSILTLTDTLILPFLLSFIPLAVKTLENKYMVIACYMTLQIINCFNVVNVQHQ